MSSIKTGMFGTGHHIRTDDGVADGADIRTAAVDRADGSEQVAETAYGGPVADETRYAVAQETDAGAARDAVQEILGDADDAVTVGDTTVMGYDDGPVTDVAVDGDGVRAYMDGFSADAARDVRAAADRAAYAS